VLKIQQMINLIMILVIKQLNAKILVFILILLDASTCFENYVLITREVKIII